MNGRIHSLREADSGAPLELVALVDALLEPDAGKRIGDAALLSAELARLSAMRTPGATGFRGR